MRSEREWGNLSVDEIEGEIRIRAKLHGEMVGLLYPSILIGEIARLGVLKAENRRL